jgi:hypothetical protein
MTGSVPTLALLGGGIAVTLAGVGLLIFLLSLVVRFVVVIIGVIPGLQLREQLRFGSGRRHFRFQFTENSIQNWRRPWSSWSIKFNGWLTWNNVRGWTVDLPWALSWRQNKHRRVRPGGVPPRQTLEWHDTKEVVLNPDGSEKRDEHGPLPIDVAVTKWGVLYRHPKFGRSRLTGGRTYLVDGVSYDKRMDAMEALKATAASGGRRRKTRA